MGFTQQRQEKRTTGHYCLSAGTWHICRLGQLLFQFPPIFSLMTKLKALQRERLYFRLLCSLCALCQIWRRSGMERNSQDSAVRKKKLCSPKKSNELFFSHHFATFVSFCLLFFSFHSHALFFSLNCYEPCFLFCPVHGPVVPSRHCATEGNTGVRFPSCLTWSQLFIISTRVLFLLLSVPNPFWSEADLIH